MRQKSSHPAAQPVVGPVPQTKDEPDVSYAGSVPIARLSSRPTLHSPPQMP
jgi:hypothetical protein